MTPVQTPPCGHTPPGRKETTPPVTCHLGGARPNPTVARPYATHLRAPSLAHKLDRHLGFVVNPPARRPLHTLDHYAQTSPFKERPTATLHTLKAPAAKPLHAANPPDPRPLLILGIKPQVTAPGGNTYPSPKNPTYWTPVTSKDPNHI